MRCVSCGLPLSLSRTSCPRCGTAVAGAQLNWDTPQQLAFPERDTATSYPPNGLLPSQPQSSLVSSNVMRQTARSLPHTSQRLFKHTTSRWSAKVGFTMAALCILAGGLILVFVYMIALGLPPLSPSTASLRKSVTAKQYISPTPVSSSVTSDMTPTPIASPVVTYPGQQYIDNAQMANAAIASPTTLVTHFKVNQRIFVTFQLHPGGHSGAVCLLWYLNNRQFTHYEFPVGATPTSAYSFASANYLGTGYVEIYWASTVACTDKLLADSVGFTVGA